MKKFSDLLHSLLYAPQRSVKQAYLEEFIKDTKDPDRGFAISALTGELSIQGVKTHLIRQIAYKRCDPLLFDLSYDFVGDLAETVALIWPTKSEKDIPGAFLKRNIIFERLRLLGRIFSPERIELIQNSLEDSDI